MSLIALEQLALFTIEELLLALLQLELAQLYNLPQVAPILRGTFKLGYVGREEQH